VRFSAITDCYALPFILSYDGPNPVILRLQMRLMLWAMDLYHRSGKYLFRPDYLSRMGADLHFCELSRLYLNKTINLRQLYPPVTGRMEPKNMPNYRAPKVKSNLGPDPVIGNLMAAISVGNSGGHVMCLQIIPIRTDLLPKDDTVSRRHVPLHNHNISVCAANLVAYSCHVWIQ
jgi:hypothetical protein